MLEFGNVLLVAAAVLIATAFVLAFAPRRHAKKGHLRKANAPLS